jgi:hypothetical protein
MFFGAILAFFIITAVTSEKNNSDDLAAFRDYTIAKQQARKEGPFKDA